MSFSTSLYRQLFCPRPIPSLNVVPSNKDLAGAEIELVEIEHREFRLKRALRVSNQNTTTSSSTARRRSAF